MTIQQADRDAAADFLEAWEPGPEMTVVKLARALATHREAERARIVAAARVKAEEYRQLHRGYDQNSHGHVLYGDMQRELLKFADAIERGEV